MTAKTKAAKTKAADRAPLPQSGWVARRTLKVGHGFIHGGEIFPDVATPALVTNGWIERGEGVQPSDPLGGVFDDAEAAAIREALGLQPEGTPAAAKPELEAEE